MKIRYQKNKIEANIQPDEFSSTAIEKVLYWLTTDYEIESELKKKKIRKNSLANLQRSARWDQRPTSRQIPFHLPPVGATEQDNERISKMQ